MADPRLNSLHLDGPRRQEYRRARDVLLRARGAQTIFASRSSPPSEIGHTLIRRHEGAAVPSLTCWLTDGEFLYPLHIGVNTVGRSSENDVVVDDAYVSRRHCAILVHSTECAELHDTASKNGILVNGLRVSSPTPLKSGDQIRISERQFLFVTRSGAADAASPQATLSN